MDYETFGEHQWADTGIFDFLRHLPGKIMENTDNNFLTPSQVIDKYDSVGEIDVPHMISWADTERDLSAWLGNAMQSNALHELYKLEGPLKEKGDRPASSRLASADHAAIISTTCARSIGRTATCTNISALMKAPTTATSIS